MQVLTMPTTLFTPIPRIGNILPINRLTLLSGLPGTGKTYTLLKFLNLNQIKPVFFNLDEDAALQRTFSLYQFDKTFLPDVVNGVATDLNGQVLVIDTYIRLMDILGMPENTKEQQQHITNLLEQLAKNSQCSVIVIGHPEDYVGRSSIFKDNPYLVRNAEEHIHLDKVLSTKRGSQPNYTMYVNKGRGIGGCTAIDDWLREPILNPLTNQMC